MIWRNNRRFIPGNMINAYIFEWREVMRREKQKIINAHNSKFEHLKRKWGKRQIAEEIYRGVVIGDVDLNKDEFTSSPRVYGGVQIDNDEEEALSLPPSFGIYQKINKDKCKIDVEESLNKLRWNINFGRVERKEDENGIEIKINENITKKEFFDKEESTFNINRLKATSLPYNHQVSLPLYIGEEEETFKKFKDSVMIKIDDMIEKSKSWEKSSISKTAREGMKKLKKRIDQKEIVCYETDKSGRWSIDSIDNYEKACKEQLSVDKMTEITEEEHTRAEIEMNAEATALTFMMGFDEEEGGDGRLVNVLKAEHTRIPPFYGMRKDHKNVEQGKEDIGPKVRPVCGAKDGVTKFRIYYVKCWNR